MARTQGTIYSSIWADPDFTALTAAAQRVYMLLVTQGKLTLVGSLDWHPRRWGRLAADTDENAVLAALEELADRRFVVVHEDELIVRSFIANDLARGTVNRNLVKGMWSAWAALDSPLLRKVVVDEMPASVWDRDGVDRPAAAEELRSQPRLELPFGPSSEPSALCSLLSADCSGSPVPTDPHPGFAGPAPVASLDAARAALAPREAGAQA